MMTQLLMLLCMVPYGTHVEDNVDRVELSHVYDERGELVLSQIIWYDWNSHRNDFDIVDWRMYRDERMRPLWNPQTRMFESVWHDGDTLRRVQAGAYRERWDQYDPELDARPVLNTSHRRKLTRAKEPD